MKRTFIDVSRLGNLSFLTPQEPQQGLRVKVNVAAMLEESLTKTQKSYIMLYYTEKRSIPEIANLFGVNKCSVSRTIRRGRKNLEKALGMVS